MPIVKRYATYEDLEAVPDTMVAELIDGDLITSPRPASPHARATTVILSTLVASFDDASRDLRAPGGWWILFEPEPHFGTNVLVPDIAGWRRERWIVASTDGGNDPITAEPFDVVTLDPSRWWLEPDGVQPIG